MRIDEADAVMRLAEGYWPTPEMAASEAQVWALELINADLAITRDEAVAEIVRMSRAGESFRPRIGQLVAAVRAARARVPVPALAAAEGDDFDYSISNPANWSAFVYGARHPNQVPHEHPRPNFDKPAPQLPDEPPDVF